MRVRFAFYCFALCEIHYDSFDSQLRMNHRLWRPDLCVFGDEEWRRLRKVENVQINKIWSLELGINF
jgi:hypothetical protein